MTVTPPPSELREALQHIDNDELHLLPFASNAVRWAIDHNLIEGDGAGLTELGKRMLRLLDKASQ